MKQYKKTKWTGETVAAWVLIAAFCAAVWIGVIKLAMVVF